MILYFNISKFQNIIFIIKCKKNLKIILTYKNIYKILTLNFKNYKIKRLFFFFKKQNYQINFLLLDYNIEKLSNPNPISFTLLYLSPLSKRQTDLSLGYTTLSCFCVISSSILNYSEWFPFFMAFLQVLLAFLFTLFSFSKLIESIIFQSSLFQPSATVGSWLILFQVSLSLYLFCSCLFCLLTRIPQPRPC